MIAAILDTNIFVRAAIRYPGSASSRAVDAYFDGKYRLVFSPATQDELLHVLNVPHIRTRLGWFDDDLLDFLTSLHADALLYPDKHTISPQITRDITDAKFLELAAESRADFLVTKDARHLLRLKQFRDTRIVTPSHFLTELP